MGISEVISPVTRRGSKVGSAQSLSPGARSDPGREGGSRFDNAQPQPQHRTATHQETPVPSSIPVTIGPED
jgi:hypothetical protein